MADILIIGGGLIGMMTARELAAAGARVRIIERGTLGRESSWAGGGILSPLYPWRYPEPVSLLAAWGQARYPALAEALSREAGIDPEWLRSGLLILDTAEAERAHAWAAERGVALELVEGAAELRRIEPACRPAERALWMPDVAQVRNPRLLAALRAALLRQGVAFEEGQKVLEIVRGQGAVSGVRTERGLTPASMVVVAGGAWSGELLAALGVRIDVTPVRGQMLLFRAEPGQITRIVLQADRYVIPRRDGHVLVGSTVEEAGFDKSTTDSAHRELKAAAENLIPALAAAPIVQHWSGLRPGSPTGVPFIGPVPGIAGLFVNAGHFRNGVVLAPGSARLLADLILHRPTEIDPAPYAIA